MLGWREAHTGEVRELQAAAREAAAEAAAALCFGGRKASDRRAAVAEDLSLQRPSALPSLTKMRWKMPRMSESPLLSPSRSY